jgi:hypothetical protein
MRINLRRQIEEKAIYEDIIWVQRFPTPCSHLPALRVWAFIHLGACSLQLELGMTRNFHAEVRLLV